MMHTKSNSLFSMASLRKVLAGCFWLGLILFCLMHRDEITLKTIVNYSPDNPMLAAAIMLALFAFKSVTFFIYGGLLYAASGLLFSLPTAVLVNLVGAAVMVSLPFFIGRRMGSDVLQKLSDKNRKLELLQDLTHKNEFFVSFFVRMAGLLPGDLVSIYLGASGLRFSRYLPGTLLGLLPSILSFSVMGMNAHDAGSPAFILSVCFEAALILFSITLFLILRRRHTRQTATPK